VRIEGVSRTGAPHPLAEAMHSASALRAALARADFVVDCRPLTLSTRGTIDASALAAMKPAGIYVNVGRAATVDEEALYRHLKAHPEFRAGMDVWWDEDHARGTVRYRFPFPQLPNFLGSPHNAGEGSDTESRGLSFALRNLSLFFSGEAPQHVADRRDYEAE